jgi:hypothetical protein
MQEKISSITRAYLPWPDSRIRLLSETAARDKRAQHFLRRAKSREVGMTKHETREDDVGEKGGGAPAMGKY